MNEILLLTQRHEVKFQEEVKSHGSKRELVELDTVLLAHLFG
jgi:hypothetical protein